MRKPDICVSALTGEGEAALIDALLEICGLHPAQSLEIALNERQRELALIAATALERTQEVADQNLPWDFWTIDLREAIYALNEVTGDDISEDLLDRIFSRFCIGK